MDRTWFQQAPMLEIPKWTVYMAIAAGAALEALLMLLTWNQEPPARHQADPTL
jgi:TRAP-type C4-dicarboxylate transport system permease small subunit